MLGERPGYTHLMKPILVVDLDRQGLLGDPLCAQPARWFPEGPSGAHREGKAQTPTAIIFKKFEDAPSQELDDWQSYRTAPDHL